MESAPGEAYSAAWGRKFRLGKIGRGNLSNIRFWAGEEYSISRPKLPPCDDDVEDAAPLLGALPGHGAEHDHLRRGQVVQVIHVHLAGVAGLKGGEG